MKGLLSTLMIFLRWGMSKQNRKVAFRYFKIGLLMAQEIRKDKKENKIKEIGLLYVLDTFKEATQLLSTSERENSAKKITKNDKELSDISLSYNSGSNTIQTELWGTSLQYDPKDGSVDFKVTL